MTQTEAVAVPPLAQRLRHFYERHERPVDIGFFVAGFVFDIATLNRVDSWISMGQQLLYLALIGAVLLHMFFDEGRPPRKLDAMPAIKRAYFQYRTPLVHFLLGALLNVYTLFFFMSSSLLVSFAFLSFLVLALLMNEWKRFKAQGVAFKFALLSLCLLSFSAVMVPVFVRSIGVWVFLLSMAIGSVPMIVLDRRIRAVAPARVDQARRQIFVPFSLVLFGFLTLYWLRLIPPVPLSIPFIGVYHLVEKTDTGYRLSDERPAWRFWQHGDQRFQAQPGDKIYVFFRIFSPAHFSDEVTVRWFWKSKGGDWKLQDAIPIAIVGGRAQGFRGYGVKTHYQPGNWKVQVETLDAREIGRIYFHVETVPEAPRTFEVTVQ
jgi:hypothetical protein